MKSLIISACMLVFLASWQIKAHDNNSSLDKSEKIENSALEAKTAVAANYAISESSVNVGTKIQYQGQEAWPFQVSSLNKSGLVINTPAGLIVEDELTGF
jgi:hypothetical protein